MGYAMLVFLVLCLGHAAYGVKKTVKGLQSIYLNHDGSAGAISESVAGAVSQLESQDLALGDVGGEGKTSKVALVAAALTEQKSFGKPSSLGLRARCGDNHPLIRQDSVDFEAGSSLIDLSQRVSRTNHSSSTHIASAASVTKMQKTFGEQTGLKPGDPLTVCGVPVTTVANEAALPGTKGDFIASGAFGDVFHWKGSQAIKEVFYDEGGDRKIKVGGQEKGNFDCFELLPMTTEPKAPFIASLNAAYHSSGDKKVWLVTPLYRGGEFFNRVVATGTGYRGGELQNLAAQMAYGLWQLHQRGFLWRDFKPENVMVVDAAGAPERLVLNDFGFAMKGGPTAFCQGAQFTPVYASPRMLEASLYHSGKRASPPSYGFEADWWAFGVNLFIAATATLPYYSDLGIEDQLKLIEENSVCWDDITNEHDGNLLALLQKLITLEGYVKLEDDAVRAKMMAGSPAAHPILSDPYFAGLDWGEICKFSIHPC